MTASTLADRVSQLQDRIERVAASSGRDPKRIQLVAVSKTRNKAIIEEAYGLGLRHFGENRVEEARQKVPALRHRSDIVWHMIGHIQGRKTRQVPTLFSWVHSIDRLKTASRLSMAAVEEGVWLNALLEVNLSGEESKHGFLLDRWPQDSQQFDAFVADVASMLTLPNLRVVGLMTMAPFSTNPEDSRPYFAGLAQLGETLAHDFPGNDWRHLSMGMTGDFEVAIEEGATILRVGTAMFGPRIL